MQPRPVRMGTAVCDRARVPWDCRCDCARMGKWTRHRVDYRQTHSACACDNMHRDACGMNQPAKATPTDTHRGQEKEALLRGCSLGQDGRGRSGGFSQELREPGFLLTLLPFSLSRNPRASAPCRALLTAQKCKHEWDTDPTEEILHPVNGYLGRSLSHRVPNSLFVTNKHQPRCGGASLHGQPAATPGEPSIGDTVLNQL